MFLNLVAIVDVVRHQILLAASTAIPHLANPPTNITTDTDIYLTFVCFILGLLDNFDDDVMYLFQIAWHSIKVPNHNLHTSFPIKSKLYRRVLQPTSLHAHDVIFCSTSLNRALKVGTNDVLEVHHL